MFYPRHQLSSMIEMYVDSLYQYPPFFVFVSKIAIPSFYFTFDRVFSKLFQLHIHFIRSLPPGSRNREKISPFLLWEIGRENKQTGGGLDCPFPHGCTHEFKGVPFFPKHGSSCLLFLFRWQSIVPTPNVKGS